MHRKSVITSAIQKLIDSGNYLNAEERAYLPTYDKLALARKIYAFNYYTNQDASQKWDFETAKRDIIPLLDSPEQVEKLFNQMLSDFTQLSPDTPHYATIQLAIRDLGAYQRGDTLLPSLLVAILTRWALPLKYEQ